MKEFSNIKEKSKKALKYHRFYSIVVCFLVSSVLSFGYKFNSGLPIEIPGISLGSVSIRRLESYCLFIIRRVSLMWERLCLLRCLNLFYGILQS